VTQIATHSRTKLHTSSDICAGDFGHRHLVHDEVPGTTFSNVAQRGAYDSDGRAVLTMAEAWG